MGLARLVLLGLGRSSLGRGLRRVGGLFGLDGSSDRSLGARLVGSFLGFDGSRRRPSRFRVGAFLLVHRLGGRALGLRSLLHGVLRHVLVDLVLLILVVGAHRTLPLASCPR